MIQRLEHWFHHHYDFVEDRAISAFRIIYALVFLFFGKVSFREIAHLSESLYRPRKSLARWFDLPDEVFFIGLDYLLIVSLVFLLFGFKTKWSSFSLGVILLVGLSFEYSFGKISHGLLFVTFLPLIMAFSNWGRYHSVDEKIGNRQQVRKWPITLMSIVMGFGMMTAGLQKLLGGWLNLNYQAIKFHLFKSYLNLREGPLTQFFVDINSSLFWETMDFMIVLFEIGFLFAVANHRLFRGWIVAALFFHIGVFLVLDIAFSNNVLAYFLFLDWVVIMSIIGFRKVLDTINYVFSFLGLITGLVFFLLLKILFGSPYIIQYVGLGRFGSNLFLLCLALGIVVISVAHKLFRKAAK